MSNIKVKSQKSKVKSQRGVSLYFALLIMTILLAIGFGLSTIILSQMKMIRGMGDSVVALHAADTGIEEALYTLYKEKAPNCSASALPFNCSGSVGQASYSVQAIAAGSPGCPQPPIEYYCLKSIGNYKGTKRAIEVTR